MVALQPQYANGRMRWIGASVTDETREDWLAEQEDLRRAVIAKCRVYYDGEQYAQENAEVMAANQIDPVTGRLPEHMRKHAYSTQIGECCDFLSDQMTKTFMIECASPEVQVYADLVMASMEDPTDLVRDGMVAGDVAVRLDWDEVLDQPTLLYYESEQVRFDFAQEDRTLLEKVVMQEVVWAEDQFGVERQRIRTTIWRYASLAESLSMPEVGEQELAGPMVVRSVQYDDDPPSVTPIAVSFLPWALLRVSKKALASTRGEPMVTQQARETADRYNAVQQVAWLIARYNSHGNVAVVGDAANLQMRQEEGVAKDVADVLSFPGGTNVVTITLPTDPEMVKQQEDALLESLYGVFGLTRIDPKSVQGLGALSGYALEILNRKTDGTFDRIRRQWSRDVIALVGLVLDYVTEMRGQQFTNRAMEVRLGGAYIVDDAQVRKDFEAGLISREEALRQRGLQDEQIQQVVQEIAFAPEPASLGFTQTLSSAGGAG